VSCSRREGTWWTARDLAHRLRRVQADRGGGGKRIEVDSWIVRCLEVRGVGEALTDLVPLSAYTSKNELLSPGERDG
jgi:hypothetical protein